jgi:uncharacterized protein YndB with AHSA1/START domain
MAAIVSQTEVSGTPDEVFAYVTDPSRFAEWQENVMGGNMDGSTCTTTRRIGGREREVTSEVTELNPPKTWGVRGVDGPIRSTVHVDVEPLAADRSRVTITLDFTGHGYGKLLIPLVQRQSRAEMSRNMARLKTCLETA